MTEVFGFDLSGPSNVADTAGVWLCADAGGLRFVRRELGLSDADVLAWCRDATGAGTAPRPCVIGLDAPLSYQPGGGDRAGDRALRSRLVEAGLATGSVMTPTMTRMAYLTLRGIAIARGILAVVPDAEIAEVHPGGVLALGGAPIDAVRGLKRDVAARVEIVAWFASRIEGVDVGLADAGDHEIAALAAAWGAWRWSRGDAAWRFPADPPLHPFDYAC